MRPFYQRLYYGIRSLRGYSSPGLPSGWVDNYDYRMETPKDGNGQPIVGAITFVEYPQVPSENNPAERAIRPRVIARKISGGTRSPVGSQTMAVLSSLFATWQLRGEESLSACRQMLRDAKQHPLATSA